VLVASPKGGGVCCVGEGDVGLAYMFCGLAPKSVGGVGVPCVVGGGGGGFASGMGGASGMGVPCVVGGGGAAGACPKGADGGVA